ncbi:MAG TPA: hypothetical protein IAA53_06510 [Candidatus Avoscillospira avicola]|uniref:Uncharacterized protein n=1 Tax=Candidatus Avoscillospira avicola TaxID=2840706 RepID=A0A9D1DHW9_9FIRM|nr:hypothetical protein [Candidatus Avoscillospira avicola]
MELTRQYNLEGTVLEIPLRYDSLSHMYLEVYPDFIQNPVYTPAGQPILFTGEDACALARSADGEPCLDCGSCRYYRQAAETLIGVCGHEQKRKIRPE